MGEYINFKKAKSGWASNKYKGYAICTRDAKQKVDTKKNTLPKASKKPHPKQELTHSRDWTRAWGTCSGYTALKKDGTLWRFPESAFSLGRYKTPLVLKKVSRFSDWKKIVLGFCTLYGVRKDGSLWKSDDIDYQGVFKKFKAKKISHDSDTELYPYLKSNMQKVPTGTIYAPQYTGEAEVNKDGTLWLFFCLRRSTESLVGC